MKERPCSCWRTFGLILEIRKIVEFFICVRPGRGRSWSYFACHSCRVVDHASLGRSFAPVGAIPQGWSSRSFLRRLMWFKNVLICRNLPQPNPPPFSGQFSISYNRYRFLFATPEFRGLSVIRPGAGDLFCCLVLVDDRWSCRGVAFFSPFFFFFTAPRLFPVLWPVGSCTLCCYNSRSLFLALAALLILDITEYFRA